MARSTRKVGRSAITGRFTSVATARNNSRTHGVETVKKTKPRKRKYVSGQLFFDRGGCPVFVLFH